MRAVKYIQLSRLLIIKDHGNFTHAVIFICSVSVPKLVNYPSTAPSLNVRNGDYSAVNISSVGPLVKVTFEASIYTPLIFCN